MLRVAMEQNEKHLPICKFFGTYVICRERPFKSKKRGGRSHDFSVFRVGWFVRYFERCVFFGLVTVHVSCRLLCWCGLELAQGGTKGFRYGRWATDKQKYKTGHAMIASLVHGLSKARVKGTMESKVCKLLPLAFTSWTTLNAIPRWKSKSQLYAHRKAQPF